MYIQEASTTNTHITDTVFVWHPLWTVRLVITVKATNVIPKESQPYRSVAFAAGATS
jgi:hypothetical protein